MTTKGAGFSAAGTGAGAADFGASFATSARDFFLGSSITMGFLAGAGSSGFTTSLISIGFFSTDSLRTTGTEGFASAAADGESLASSGLASALAAAAFFSGDTIWTSVLVSGSMMAMAFVLRLALSAMMAASAAEPPPGAP